MKFLILILMFFVLSALLIISNNNLYIGNGKDFKIFFDSYINWADNFYLNSQKIVGGVIKINWFPE